MGASVILIFSLSLQLQSQPYDSAGHDRMESYSLHCSLMILMFVLLCSICGGDVVTGKLGPISSVLLIVVVFSCTIFFFTMAMKQVCKHSHENKSFVGKIARRLTTKTTLRRRHSIHNTGDVRPSRAIHRGDRGGGGKLARTLTIDHVRKEVVIDRTHKIEVNSTQRRHSTDNVATCSGGGEKKQQCSYVTSEVVENTVVLDIII